MRITAIRVDTVTAPLARPFWMSLEPYTAASELVVRVKTDAGLTGLGEIHGRPLDQIAAIVTGAFAPLLAGRDPLDHERHWSAMFAYTHTRAGAALSAAEGQPHFGAGARPQLMAALAGIDIALWDLKGKICGQPVYKLLGASRDAVPCYASGGYYGPDGGADVAGLVEELRGYVALGYPAVKMKVGGLAIEEDARRVAAAREALGPGVGLMLDANLAYDVPTAIAAARAFEPFDIAWLEEPVHWYDSVHGLGQVAAATRIPLASGESELHRWGCRDLILHSGIRVMQFDATRAGGVTEWLRVAAYAAAHGVLMAPHHDPQIHAHLIAAAPNGHLQEVFPNPVRDPLWAGLFTGKPEIADGILRLPDRPGFGFDLAPREDPGA
ncbi:MAG TPA: mandelate racemase/muconate lactonizing enzyme family protein [Thermomicrobiales bacterium]|nr:mandelate racemase/muconate lactonizing enzyme family protein [Thermomicrobiales bacterium]